MGFLDSMTSAVDRGAAAVGRTTRSTQIKMQLSDIDKRRRDVAAQLGASLYEATRDDAGLRSGREALYDGMASLDLQRENLMEELQEIEAMASAAQQARLAGIRCPRCGIEIRGDDSFCMGCGMPAEKARNAAAPQTGAPTAGIGQQDAAFGAGLLCPNCCAAVGQSDAFCMGCGFQLGSASHQGIELPQL